MSSKMADALGTGIGAGIWGFLASVIGLFSWVGFAGCTSYFVAGGGKKGLKKSLLCNFTGIGWAMAVILLSSNENSILLSALLTGFITWVMCYQSKVELLSSVPSTFIGCFSTFALNGNWKVLVICFLCGNILGICCDYSGKYLFRIFGKRKSGELEMM